MTPEERADVARSHDGRRGWVTVPIVVDGGSLRIGHGDGELVDEDQAEDLIWDGTT
jgi:hypothetical protein